MISLTKIFQPTSASSEIRPFLPHVKIDTICLHKEGCLIEVGILFLSVRVMYKGYYLREATIQRWESDRGNI